MKKILILLALLLIGGVGYYFGFGAEKLTESLKAQVDTQLQTLQKNGFEIENRKVEKKSEHFVLHYADPIKISHYFKSKNIDIDDEDTQALQGMKVGVDLSYLDGAYSALSADLYPVAFPPALLQEADAGERKIMEKIIQEKIFLAHLDINKLFTAFKGYLKDIDSTFESEDALTLQSKGFAFAGTFDDTLLTSSSNTIKQLNISTKSGVVFKLKGLEGEYEQVGKNIYDFNSKYSLKSLRIHDENRQGAAIDELTFNSSGKAKDDLASSDFALHIKSVEVNEPQGKHLFEGVTNKVSLENLSISALTKMGQLKEEDTEGFNAALKELFAQGIIIKVDELSAKKVREGETGKMIDGFLVNAVIEVDKITNFKQLEENPFSLLNTFDATMHMEFSDDLYLTLQKRPELALAMILFSPVSKNGKMIFDVDYKDGALKINGKSAL